MDERVKATVSATAVILVNCLSMMGISLDLGMVTDAFLAIAMLIATFWGIWKNHNWSRAAQQGQLVTDKLKNEQRAIELKEE